MKKHNNIKIPSSLEGKVSIDEINAVLKSTSSTSISRADGSTFTMTPKRIFEILEAEEKWEEECAAMNQTDDYTDSLPYNQGA